MFDFTVSEVIDAEAEFLERLKARTKAWRAVTGAQATIPVWICAEKEMIRLNARFRSAERLTDVLSWPYAEDDEAFGDCPGEIAVCWSACRSQATDNGWDAETEMIRLLAHGVAHIMGYEHPTPTKETDMIRFEKTLLELADCPPLYPP